MTPTPTLTATPTLTLTLTPTLTLTLTPTLTRARDFSNAKRSPVGLELFVEACMGQGAREEAARYAVRTPAPTLPSPLPYL